ncbi:biliverdin-producing heme oxygenase [Paenibacillus sp. FSL R5-0486]|uniref:biliverdin-producing heme oxygenase n=1 Tax=Paenibacillus sp. FSL R5-0486 TaxID=2921645 RepID=UPI0030D83ED8
MTATTIMERLKSETAHYHRQVEQNPYAKAIMNQTVTIEEYRTYLEKFYGFLKPLEDQAVQQPFWESTGLDIEIRGKAGLLEKDLRNLGASEEEITQLPLCEELPDISTPARLFGYLYVIEGSTNGGQIITKRLSQFLTIEADRGLEYFNAYGSETRTRWSEFTGLLQRSISNPEDHDNMVHSASETFRLLDQWINT